MDKYPNLGMLLAGCCGPTAEWIRVIPEVKALLKENEELKQALAVARSGGVYAAPSGGEAGGNTEIPKEAVGDGTAGDSVGSDSLVGLEG